MELRLGKWLVGFAALHAASVVLAQPVSGTWIDIGGPVGAEAKTVKTAPPADPSAPSYPLAVTWAPTANTAPRPIIIRLGDLFPLPPGSDAPEAIEADLLKDGYLVVTLDCRQLPAASPAREEAIARFNRDLPLTLKKVVPAATAWDENQIFYLPPGYRLARGVPYFNVEKHGPKGIPERVVATYNSYVVEKFKVPPIKSPDELRSPTGKAIDYTLSLDLIYPTHPVKDVPLVVNFATQTVRMKSFAPATSDRATYPIGFLASGYAWANVDHCWNPLARPENYGYWAQYTLEDYAGLRSATAAIRFFRANATKYHLNGKIGVMGISKASYSAMRLADPGHVKGKEHARFSGQPDESPEPQPWPGVSSLVDVAYSAAGNGTRRTKYLTSKTVPLVTSAGESDQYKQWDVYPAVVAKADAEGTNHVDLWMEDRGHTYPTGKDLGSGENRYWLVKRFFDQQLLEQAPQVLFMYPRDGATGVALDGKSRVLTEDTKLPKEMEGLTPDRPITVRFARSMDVASVKEHVAVLDSAGKPVGGTWTASQEDSRFTFTPVSPLAGGANFTVMARAGARDKKGGIVEGEVSHRFTTKP